MANETTPTLKLLNPRSKIHNFFTSQSPAPQAPSIAVGDAPATTQTAAEPLTKPRRNADVFFETETIIRHHQSLATRHREEGALRGEGIRNPLDAGLQVVPVCGGLRRELGEVFYGLGAAIGGGDQVPAALDGEDCDESGELSFRAAGREDDAAVMVPRLETGIAVILQYCNATSMLSSRSQRGRDLIFDIHGI